MKQLKNNELYRHLGDFLKAKGIQLTDGSYSQSIQKGCTLLTDAINLSQQGLERAKGNIDRKLDQLRQVIHEKTAPKSPAPPSPPPPPPPPAASARAAKAAKRSKPARAREAKTRRPHAS